jgi:hypothetical protein
LLNKDVILLLKDKIVIKSLSIVPFEDYLQVKKATLGLSSTTRNIIFCMQQLFLLQVVGKIIKDSFANDL